MSALKRIEGLTLAHLDALRNAAAYHGYYGEGNSILLSEIADAIAPYIARAMADETQGQSAA